MKFKKFLLFGLIFVLLSGPVSYSFNLISVEVIQKSEDTSEERIEQFATHQQQKLISKKPFNVQKWTNTIAVNVVKEFSVALCDSPSKIYLRNKVFRN